ncbi:MAG: hypothetical protein DBX47_03725 [Clostridiales bacterium]|nr:MAG: hypothetical protein DBX47_03725 [Clostridiales bacterium]
MDHVKKARELFLEGFNCAQAVFGAFCDVTEIDFEKAILLASSFGGGIGGMRQTCGACTGAFMVLGIKKGYSDPKASTEKKEHYKRIQKFADKFKEKNNTIICGELLVGLKAATSNTPENRTDEYYKTRPCLRFVEDAAQILDEMI